MSNDSTEKENHSGDALLLVVVIWLVFNQTVWAVLPVLIGDFYSRPWFQPFSTVVNFIWAFVPLALAFTAKGKTIKTLLFILGGLYLFHGLVQILIPVIKNILPF